MFRTAVLNSKPQLSRGFMSSAVRSVSVGQKLPSSTLFEGSPGNNVSIVEEIGQDKAVIIGVPGAFSPACSASHVPGYLKQLAAFKNKGYDKVFVVGVNDAFVFKAWGDQLDNSGSIRFLADPKGEFTSALDLTFDASKFFGNHRSKRFALLINDGKVERTFIEPDNVSVDVSSAEKVLEDL